MGFCLPPIPVFYCLPFLLKMVRTIRRILNCSITDDQLFDVGMVKTAKNMGVVSSFFFPERIFQVFARGKCRNNSSR